MNRRSVIGAIAQAAAAAFAGAFVASIVEPPAGAKWLALAAAIACGAVAVWARSRGVAA